jgi:hypothetical protein
MTVEEIMNFDKKDTEFEGILAQTFNQVLGNKKVDDDIQTTWLSSQNEEPTFL